MVFFFLPYFLWNSYSIYCRMGTWTNLGIMDKICLVMGPLATAISLPAAYLLLAEDIRLGRRHLAALNRR